MHNFYQPDINESNPNQNPILTPTNNKSPTYPEPNNNLNFSLNCGISEDVLQNKNVNVKIFDSHGDNEEDMVT